jgi:ABC-type lipoprotein export system ATPase subunit
VSITAERGEVAALLGPSGSGKSTLLTALGFLNLPERGKIWLDERLVVADGRALTDLAAVRRTSVGFVFQKANLIPFLTARENVLLALQLNDRSGGRRMHGRASCSAISASRTAWTTTLSSSPADNNSASPSPGRWRTDRRSCSPTSPPRRSTATAGAT